jgi:hypothetical protein
MEKIEHRDHNGRLYEAMRDGDQVIIIGPPEGLVDSLGLPEPFATNLHNILYRRGLRSYKDISKGHNSLVGALQEALNLDAQLLTEAFFKYEKEEVLT